MNGENAARKRIDHERHPRPAKPVSTGGVGQLDIQLGMIRVADLKRPIAVPRRF